MSTTPWQAVALALLATAAVPASAASPDGPVADRARALVCEGRSVCDIVEMAEASPGGGDARTLTLVTVAMPETPSEEGLPPCRPGLREIWLVDSAAEEPILLQTLCNDGYGASQVGEDAITLAPGRYTHTQSGGSSWRWSVETAVDLVNRRVLRQSTCSYPTLAPIFEIVDWDFTVPRATGAARRLACTPDGPAADEEADPGCRPEAASVTFTVVPVLDLMGEDLVLAAEADLGDCGVRLDASGAGGFLVHGGPGTPEDAVMSAVMLDSVTLLVTVRDDRLVTGSPNPLHDDHLELWLTGFSDPWCESADVKPVQLLIGPDGTLTQAHGDAYDGAAASVRVAGAAGEAAVLTFRVTMPELPRRLTLVYSDGDDGRSQERLLATSPVRFGRAETLGQPVSVPPGGLTCAVTDGELRIRERGGLSVLPTTDR